MDRLCKGNDSQFYSYTQVCWLLWDKHVIYQSFTCVQQSNTLMKGALFLEIFFSNSWILERDACCFVRISLLFGVFAFRPLLKAYKKHSCKIYALKLRFDICEEHITMKLLLLFCFLVQFFTTHFGCTHSHFHVYLNGLSDIVQWFQPLVEPVKMIIF